MTKKQSNMKYKTRMKKKYFQGWIRFEKQHTEIPIPNSYSRGAEIANKNKKAIFNWDLSVQDELQVLILIPDRHSFHHNSKTGVLKIELRRMKKSQIYFSISALFWRLDLSKSYFGESLLSVSILLVYFSNLKLVFTFWMLRHKSNSSGFTA